ncbi:cytochrome P450 [Amycolatopsis sp. EV170708-02-1]|uniref:cytochrome P450 n=1 Tax=Amycolatopsis sp. EV170708-02-1 TaxID=2919322 RepID=UPI001F0CBA91|nr:cytochrome P450 [Amycolatopsis sp. EV170708-02-1]UMP04099.1 cytochrome P450 [Amycolatopsis sp. EV170708-02-1]
MPTTLTWDPLDPAFLADPYPIYRELRERHPVHWHRTLESWVVSRYSHCLAVLENTDAFGADPRKIGEDLPEPGGSIQTLDPPEQTVVRRMIVHAMRSLDLDEIVRTAWRRADELVRAAEGREIDFVEAVSLPITTELTMTAVGAPDSAAHDFGEVSAVIIRGMMSGLLPDGREAELAAARRQLSTMLEQWWHGPAGGVLAALRENPLAGKADLRVLMNSVRVLLLAGINSTQRFVSLALYALLARPGGLRSIAGTTDLKRLLHELIRFDGSAQVASRYCVKSTVLGEQRIEAGETVILLLGAANRDERRFGDAADLVPDRAANPHLGFGHGTHACVGISLALAVGDGVLRALAAHYPDMCLAPGAIRDPNPALRGFQRLPIAPGGRRERG